MNSFKKKNDWGDVTDERMMEYLLTWLAVLGNEVVDIDEATEVDEIIGDIDELCWSIAIDEGFISRAKGEVERIYHLTDTAYDYIKGEQNGNNTRDKT
jgi:hypothetical protein